MRQRAIKDYMVAFRERHGPLEVVRKLIVEEAY
jgi:hypothetical protein